MIWYAAIIIGFYILKLNAHAHCSGIVANGGYGARRYTSHGNERSPAKSVVWELQFNAGSTSRQFVSDR